MMKRILCVLFCGLATGAVLFAEMRIDLGTDLLFQETGNNLNSEAIEMNAILVPEVAFYGQFNFGQFHTGLGLRGFSYFLITSALWPSVYAEYHLGKVVFHAQLGGGFFAVLGDQTYFRQDYYTEEGGSSPSFQLRMSEMIIPELSIWFRFLRFFRIGGGWTQMFMLNPNKVNFFDIDPRFYIALKAVFPSPDGRRNIF
jgi:hypothetical protein